MGNDLYNSTRRSRLSLLLEKLRLINSSGIQRVGKESWIWKCFPSGVNNFFSNAGIGPQDAILLKSISVILMRNSYFKNRQRKEIMSNLENEIRTRLY